MLVVWVALILGVQGVAPAESPADVVFTDRATVSWSPVAAADAYHVYVGTDPAAGDATCRAYGVEGTSAAIPDQPPPGALRYVLVSAVNADGESPFGPDSTGVPRANVASRF